MSSAGPFAEEPPVEHIRVRGARVHNLKNLDVDIPRDRLVVITGLSGSGKSSLAFDTIYAEGQRQYIESLSVYARQFLHQLERPDADLIDGLQPTLAIDQRAGSSSPRSTVATVTEIYDYLRLLLARLGIPSCYQCGTPIQQQSPEQIVDELLGMPERTKAMLLAPLVRGERGQHASAFEAIRKAGYVRARVDGEVLDLEQLGELKAQKKHTIEAVIDRVLLREGIRPRLTDSLAAALKLGEGVAIVSFLEGEPGSETWRDRLFNTRLACPNCHISYAEIEPRTFGFNTPHGACPACEGLGGKVGFDAELVVPDRSRSLAGGAVAPWRTLTAAEQRKRRKRIDGFVASQGVDFDSPLQTWKPKTLERLFEGYGDFPGLLTLLEQELATQLDAERRAELEAFRGRVPCADCGGSRLRAEARAVRFAERTMHELVSQTIARAREFFSAVVLPAEQQPVGTPLITQILNRLDFLYRVGLEYLTLDRAADTLSGGESQRVRLASSIGSGLVGVCYVLDEPSIGLHPRDNQRLIDALVELKAQGNSVLVVEHDEAIIRQADWLFDIGPGAGSHGGRVIAQGTALDLAADPESPTGRFLSGREQIAPPASRRPVDPKRAVMLTGVQTHNLRAIDVRFPLGLLVCVTGVSGSGKSSLVGDTLVPALAHKLGLSAPRAGAHRELSISGPLDKLVVIDQTTLGRTPRSNPATYTGLFDEIRKIFAQTRDAKLRGYSASRFSFNTSGGRCEECQGQGTRRIEMNFLPDMFVACPECNGARFNGQTLKIRYRGRSIADVLSMSVDEAREFFESFPTPVRLLESLQEVGLGYLPLGQSSLALSGGEAQRIKLASELARVNTGRTLYVLDEPTTGLHLADIRKLMAVLQRLVDLGNSVILVEHQLDVIRAADWLIDLGPEGGERGGQLVAEGTPEAVAQNPDSLTGRFLAPSNSA